MTSVDGWTALGWTATPDGNPDTFSLGRESELVCARCSEPGPWTLRLLPNGELAHRDYAVCRCGELRYVADVWPGAQMPDQSR